MSGELIEDGGTNAQVIETQDQVREDVAESSDIFEYCCHIREKPVLCGMWAFYKPLGFDVFRPC